MTRTARFLLVILVGTLLASWYFTAFEKVTVTIFTGYHGEARVNQFLAAERFLQWLDIDAASVSSLQPTEWLPDISDTLVTRVHAPIATPTESAVLLDWVAAGGHLVLMPAFAETAHASALLQDLDFDFVPTEIDSEWQDSLADEGDDSREFDYYLQLSSTPYRLEFDASVPLQATLSDATGLIAARRGYGDGYVTAFADWKYFSNFFLSEGDHGRLLADAVAGDIDPGTVWFVYDTSFPSLLAIIWNNVPQLVLTLAVLLAAFLWMRIPRFGPPLPDIPQERRSILEHVRAAGHFVWRNHGAASLAQSSAAALLHEAELRHPGVSRLSLDEQARTIARITGVSAQEIADALSGSGGTRHRDFTHDMQAIRKIRNEL